MRRIRFNIASLLVVVLFAAVGFAALRESSDLWESGLFTLTLGVLLISMILAVHRTESKRAFWIGFAVFGSAYLGLTLKPSIESRLMTTKTLAYLDSKVLGRSPAVTLYTTINSGTGGIQVQKVVIHPENQRATWRKGQGWIMGVATVNLFGGRGGTTENFVRIGHSLVALLMGWFDGLFSRRLWRSSRSTESTAAVEAQGTAS